MTDLNKDDSKMVDKKFAEVVISISEEEILERLFNATSEILITGKATVGDMTITLTNSKPDETGE